MRAKNGSINMPHRHLERAHHHLSMAAKKIGHEAGGGVHEKTTAHRHGGHAKHHEAGGGTRKHHEAGGGARKCGGTAKHHEAGGGVRHRSHHEAGGGARKCGGSAKHHEAGGGVRKRGGKC
jgi:hypothetical protein